MFFTTLIMYVGIIVIVYALLKMDNRQANRLPPGPTPWPIVGNLHHLGPIPHHSLAALATRYGPLMHLRFGFADVVVATSASVAKQFLKDHDAKFSNRPPSSGGKHITYNYQDLVFAPYGPRWRMLRKICSVHLFSNKALDDFCHVRQEEVAILIRTLFGMEQSTVILGQLLSACTTNALARVTLGRRVVGNGSRGGNQKTDGIKDMVVELIQLAGEFNIGDFIPALDWLDMQGMTRKMKRIHARFDLFLDNILEEHKSGSNSVKSHAHFLSTLISLKDDADGKGQKLSDVQIKALLLNLFVAGTDTSYTTTEWAIAELIRHPRILKQAQEEMDNVIGRDRLVTESDLSQLTFLQAIVKENFRLHPSTPLSLPRVSSQSCEVNGYDIPQGSILLVHVWAIGREPNMWTNPLEFWPARFFSGGQKSDTDVKGNDFELIPFGAGRRICVGMSLALRMVQLLTATLIHAFDWELANGLEPENLNMEEAYGLGLRRAEPLIVHPRPRLGPHVYTSW